MLFKMRKLISPFGYPYLIVRYKNEIQTVIQHVLFSFSFIYLNEFWNISKKQNNLVVSEFDNKITEHDEVLLFRRLKNGDIVWLAKAAYIFCISLGFSDVTNFYSFTSFDSNVEHCILVFYIKTF